MLTLTAPSRHRNCDGTTRRDFIRAGSLAVGGLSLPWLLNAKAHAAEGGFPDFVRDKAIVVIFLAGGASHIETFNPNMDGPEPSRSITGEVKSSIPGVTLGATFPKLAERLDQAILVRYPRRDVPEARRATGSSNLGAFVQASGRQSRASD